MATIKVDTGTEELLCEIQDRVATITLNRPEVRNAFGDTKTPALRTTIQEMASDDTVGSIILTGSGKAFCAGGDVKSMGQRNPPPKPNNRPKDKYPEGAPKNPDREPKASP